IRGAEVWWEVEDVAHELGVLHRGDTLLLCQFDQDRFSDEALERAERAHPLSVAASSAGFTASAPLRVERREGVLHLSGELDRGTASLLATACRGSVGTVTIDLAEATFFDAGAHRAVTKIAKSCKRVRLRNAPPIVQRVVFALADEGGPEIGGGGGGPPDRGRGGRTLDEGRVGACRSPRTTGRRRSVPGRRNSRRTREVRGGTCPRSPSRIRRPWTASRPWPPTAGSP